MKKKVMKKKASGQTRKKREIWAGKKEIRPPGDPEMILWGPKNPQKSTPKTPPKSIFRALRALFSHFRALRGLIFHFRALRGIFPFSGPAGPFHPVFRALRGLLPHFRALRGLLPYFFRALRGRGSGSEIQGKKGS